MNQNLRFIASFVTILLLGMLAFIYQTHYLGGLRSRSDSRAVAVGSSASSLEQSTRQESAAAMEKQSLAAATVATVDPV
jgi:hypothetical protein